MSSFPPVTVTTNGVFQVTEVNVCVAAEGVHSPVCEIVTTTSATGWLSSTSEYVSVPPFSLRSSAAPVSVKAATSLSVTSTASDAAGAALTMSTGADLYPGADVVSDISNCSVNGEVSSIASSRAETTSVCGVFQLP